MKKNFQKIKKIWCYFFHTNRKYVSFGTQKVWLCKKCESKFKYNPVTNDTGPR